MTYPSAFILDYYEEQKYHKISYNKTLPVPNTLWHYKYNVSWSKRIQTVVLDDITSVPLEPTLMKKINLIPCLNQIHDVTMTIQYTTSSQRTTQQEANWY